MQKAFLSLWAIKKLAVGQLRSMSPGWPVSAESNCILQVSLLCSVLSLLSRLLSISTVSFTVSKPVILNLSLAQEFF